VQTVSAFNLEDGTVDDPGKTYYSLSELQKRPAGIDHLNLENYLSNADFMTVFGMTRKNFESLPAWKKKNLKSAQKLF
jgi:hypothetical protein